MSRFDQIRSILWPKGPSPYIWAVLDCARDPKIYRAIYDSHNFSACLYSGEISHTLVRVAPHLVRLEYEDKRLTQRMFEEFWGQSWGIIVKCDEGLDGLRRHLRKFLMVQDHGGRRLVFRYYDPRVFRAYLPTCRPGELDQIFGPIECFWAEGESDTQFIKYERTGRELEQQRLEIKKGQL